MEYLVLIIISVLFLLLLLNKRKENFDYKYIKEYKPTNKGIQLYSNIISRPKQKNIRKYSGNCTNELYPQKTSRFGGGEMTIPCDPSVESEHYGMRPILNSNNYHEIIEHLFDYMSEKISYDDSKLKYKEEFSNENEYTHVMKFLMDRIYSTMEILPVFSEYAKNDTWKGEHFVFLNEQIFIFSENDTSNMSQQQRALLARVENTKNDKKIIVKFTLYNTKRSISSDVISELLLIDNKLKIKSIDFASKKQENWVEAFQQGKKNGINIDCINKDEPSWIFGNTIENESFNCKGFKSENESENYTIKGGVPEELIPMLQNCQNTNLLPCNTFQTLDGGSDAYNTVHNGDEKWSYH